MVKHSKATTDNLPSAAIFDVDGTLCDVRSVRKYVEPNNAILNFKKDYARFHRESLGCPPHTQVAELARQLRSKNIKILVVSGRQQRWMAITKQWLAKWEIEYDDLYLRSDKDFRPDVQVKEEIAETIYEKYDPIVAIDDRDDIITVWKRLEIPAVKVSEDGSFSLPEIDSPLLTLLPHF